jgi:histone chaperone ASF1
MAKVQLNNIVVLDSPSLFYSTFCFEIAFKCIKNLSEDVEWKIIYVSSTESEEYNQVLDCFVGPCSAGRNLFVFQDDTPIPGFIPDADEIVAIVMLLPCT